jgi:hypothetical protein
MKNTNRKLPDPLVFIGYALGAIALLIISSMCSSCSPNLVRTVVMGPVVFADTSMAQPYYALVPNADTESCERWMRWDPWELQNNYNIAAEPGDTIEVMWVAKCDLDTLGRLTLVGHSENQRTYQDTIVLDGSHYFKGAQNEKR